MKQILIAVKATIVLTLLTGLAYPLLVTGLSQVLFRNRANGSLIVAGGKNIGSEIIGQHFTKPEYFHGRPDGFDGLSSGGSNFGPTNQKLIDRVGRREEVSRGESHVHRPDPGGYSHVFGQRIGPGHQPRSGGRSGGPGRRRARRNRGNDSAASGLGQHRRAAVRHLGRAARQRLAVEPGVGWSDRMQ